MEVIFCYLFFVWFKAILGFLISGQPQFPEFTHHVFIYSFKWSWGRSLTKALIFRVIILFWTFMRIWQIWCRWKATVEWNIAMEIILKKRRIRVEKILNFLCKLVTDCKFCSQNYQSFLVMKILFLFWFMKYFHRYKNLRLCSRFFLFLKINVNMKIE